VVVQSVREHVLKAAPPRLESSFHVRISSVRRSHALLIRGAVGLFRRIGFSASATARRRVCNRRAAHASNSCVSGRYSIALAQERHLDGLNDIELAAARLLSGHAPPSVLEEATPHHEFAAATQRGHLWVALDGDSPVGFAHVKMLSCELPHLEEIDVHPDHGRRGLGTRLVRAVCQWATVAGYAQLTLTTFRLVPWNMPWYARLGFVELPAPQWPDALRRLVDAETARGLDPALRVVMTHRCESDLSMPPPSSRA
jgi:GNAT superfamily N-acetyltransferase